MPRMTVWLACAALVLGACGPKLGGQETSKALEKRPALPDYNLSREALAIEGYDPVSYRPEGGGAPKAGDPTIATTYEGVTYRFVSAENRDRFLASPRHYEPAYGGWCAYAMAKGNKISVDPEAFVIQDDRLLLFYRTALNDTRDKWAEKPDDMLIDADINWRNWTGECPHTRLAGDGAMSPIDGPAAADEAAADEAPPAEAEAEEEADAAEATDASSDAGDDESAGDEA